MEVNFHDLHLVHIRADDISHNLSSVYQLGRNYLHVLPLMHFGIQFYCLIFGTTAIQMQIFYIKSAPFYFKCIAGTLGIHFRYTFSKVEFIIFHVVKRWDVLVYNIMRVLQVGLENPQCGVLILRIYTQAL